MFHCDFNKFFLQCQLILWQINRFCSNLKTVTVYSTLNIIRLKVNKDCDAVCLFVGRLCSNTFSYIIVGLSNQWKPESQHWGKRGLHITSLPSSRESPLRGQRGQTHACSLRWRCDCGVCGWMSAQCLPLSALYAGLDAVWRPSSSAAGRKWMWLWVPALFCQRIIEPLFNLHQLCVTDCKELASCRQTLD